MTNNTLCVSSIVCGIVHMVAFSKHLRFYNNSAVFLFSMYTVGIATSIWNHGTTSELSKWADRSFMILGVCTDIVWSVHCLECMQLLFSATILFCIAKLVQLYEYRYSHLYYVYTGIHVLSHITITFCHVHIIQQLPLLY